MPRFRIQSNLHLDGFQMLDACLENVTSFEGLDDRNTGRIVFLNGSSSNKSNLHPAVFYGNEFKGLAYLDDIDKITNGEGSLGMRVKALEDMLGLQDVTDVIDTWNDVKEFFKDVDEGLNLMTMLDDKLSKSEGGTISKNLSVNGYIYAYSRIVEYGLMEFRYGDNLFAFLANNAHAGREGKNLAIYNGTSWYDLLHAGNVGEYKAGDSAKLNGKEARYYMDSFMLDTGTDLNTNLVSAARPYIATLYDSNHPNQPDSKLANGNILHIASPAAQTAWELIAGFSSSSPLMFRCGTWKADGTGSINTRDWKTIAFTDSTVEAANRLANKVSLWGNEFDGTQSLATANIFMANNKGVYGITTDSKYIIALNISSDNVLRVGYGTNYSGETINTYIYGNELKFYTGAQQNAMTITDEGNVLVGTTETKDTKLKVGGRTHIVGFELSEVTTLDNEPSSGLKIGSEGVALYQFMDLNGKGYIQAARFGANPYLFALNLNPLGGAVNVGEGGLNVNGTIKSGDKFLLTTTSMNLGSATTPLYLFLARPDANFIWASANGGYINLGVYDTGTTNAANATLSIYSDRVVSGQRNNAVSLGTSNYRWSDVYSVLGNFSGRVLIGSAEDDADYALNVKGDSYFGGTVYIPTGQKLTIGDANGDHATIEYDSIAKAIKVDGNLFTTGTNASGGKADAQQGGTGGNAEVHEYEFLAGQSTYTELNPKGSRNVIVQIYEWNANGNTWDMILTDVSVTNENIIVTFGRDTTVNHLMTVV